MLPTSAEDYARSLGYTVKTLTGTCLTATGQLVQHVIDARVALEAQRLLVHTDEPVAVIGGRRPSPQPNGPHGAFIAKIDVSARIGG